LVPKETPNDSVAVVGEERTPTTASNELKMDDLCTCSFKWPSYVEANNRRLH